MSNKIDLIGIDRILHPVSADYAFISNTQHLPKLTMTGQYTTNSIGLRLCKICSLASVE